MRRCSGVSLALRPRPRARAAKGACLALAPPHRQMRAV
jgi:hypothetical protein